MQPNFHTVMSKKSDEQLIKIVTIDRDGYQPIAVEAAESEISKRGIDIHAKTKIAEEIQIEINHHHQLNANRAEPILRFINVFVDSLIIFFATFIIGLLQMIYFTNDQSDYSYLAGILEILIIYIGYYAYFEMKYQKTIGKMATKTKVVSLDGGVPTSNDILRRTISRLLPFDCISYLFTRNGLHDRFSDTMVVNDNFNSL